MTAIQFILSLYCKNEFIIMLQVVFSQIECVFLLQVGAQMEMT